MADDLARKMRGGLPPLLSVPASELTGHVLSGSVVSVNEILDGRISSELRVAISLLHSLTADNANLLVVVRPEMFPHGATRAWLRDRIGATDAHLCLSDGDAVRVVPGLENHVFFYRCGDARCQEGYLRLRRRAPQLLGSLASQVNTAFNLKIDREQRLPTSWLAVSSVGKDHGLFLPFFAPRSRVTHDAAELARQDPVNLPVRHATTYAAVSHAALQSVAFMSGLVNTIIKAYTEPESLLVIGAPLGVEPEEAVLPLLDAIYRHGFALPSGIAPNVLIHVGDDNQLSDAIFAGRTRFVAYEADTFWRRSANFYAPFETVTVLREERSVFHPVELGVVLERLTARRWEEVTLPISENICLARYVW